MVKQGIAPSEAWKLDYPEIHHILDLKTNSGGGDISMMINSERKANGAKEKRYLIQ